MTSAPEPDLGAVVVNFNTHDVLGPCLASLVRARPAQIVVVDNASTDGSAAMVRRDFPSVDLIANDVNRGYGAAANQGFAACSSAAVLVLNSDVRVAEDTIRELARYLAANPQAAVVGPRLANADGSLQRSAYPFPSAADVALGESGLHLLIRRVPWLRDRFLRTWSHDVARRVPWVLGAALAIRRGPFDAVRGFDESYFLYSEEVDLCRRLAARGDETHYAPVTTVVHLGGQSTARAGPRMRRELIVSKGIYLRRHESRAKTMRVLATLRTIAVARLVRDAVRLWFARNADERLRLRAAVVAGKALVTEQELWRA
jgi:GT2 family glycosyltransferase